MIAGAYNKAAETTRTAYTIYTASSNSTASTTADSTDVGCFKFIIADDPAIEELTPRIEIRHRSFTPPMSRSEYIREAFKADRLEPRSYKRFKRKSAKRKYRRIK